ncbi:outer membrane beta-barrel protein [Phycisphaerales bacterium AB-hyl4]|uniref:Outer membrane beta-barrel protein n=1 Tax=Natronomicrosphaera hydrolytica TaxID=3242702 RepID=A0ABV4U7B7_9BACT
MRYLMMSLLAVVVFSAPALAQQPGAFGPRQGDWEMTVAGFGASDRNIDNGNIAVTGEVGHYLTRELLVGARQDLSWVGGSDTSDSYAGATRAVAQWHFDFGEWRPFVGANLGYVYGRDRADSGTVGPEGGVKWYLQETTFVFARAGFDVEFRSSSDIDRRRGSWTYALGLGFNF